MFLVNDVDVDEGEELILEIHEKTSDKKPPKRSWMQAYRDDEKLDKCKRRPKEST